MDQWIWVANGATVVCDQERNLLGSDLNALHFAQLVLEDGKIITLPSDNFKSCQNLNVFPENVIEMAMNLDEREPINDRIGELLILALF